MHKRLIVFFLANIHILLAKSPFSSITITSNRALLEKAKHDKELMHIAYSGNVRVRLNDGSFITAQKLDLLIAKKALGKTEQGAQISPVKKAVFIGNVYAKKQFQEVNADRLDLFIPEKKCIVRGNVVLKQTKQKKRDVPLQTTCNEAELSWDTHEATLLGSKKKPVETLIELNKT